MRQFLISAFTFLLLLDLAGKTRLEPADSVDNWDWFKENSKSLIFYSSVFPDPVLITGYDGIKSHLASQGLKQDKFFNQFLFGFGLRLQKFWVDSQIAFSSSGNVEKLVNGNTVVNFDTDFYQATLSIGYIVFSNHFISIMPRVVKYSPKIGQ